jgi:hypothetical protein
LNASAANGDTRRVRVTVHGASREERDGDSRRSGVRFGRSSNGEASERSHCDLEGRYVDDRDSDPAATPGDDAAGAYPPAARAPEHAPARRGREATLKQTFSFVEFLTDRLDWQPSKLQAQAVVQGHCHHRAAEKTMSHDRELLDRLGLDYEILDTGCCGMAGSFGYHAGEHYDVSVKVAERSLLPKLKDVGESMLVIADDFSCRGQIDQLDGRHALHVAQVVQRALRESGRTGPEKAEPAPRRNRRLLLGTGAALAALAAGVLALRR